MENPSIKKTKELLKFMSTQQLKTQDPETELLPTKKTAKKVFPTVRLVRAAMIAALYASLCLLPFSQSTVQFRVSEALTILPLFFIEAIPGLFIGCFIGNLIGAPSLPNVALGSTATLIAAVLTYLIRINVRNEIARITLGVIPPIVVNALIVPLIFIAEGSVMYAYYLQAVWIFLGQAGVLILLGIPLYYGIKRLLKEEKPISQSVPKP